MGLRLYSSWNYTTAANARTITIEIIETKNCSFTFFDNMTKYADAPGSGNTNYNTYSEFDFANNGLQETGDNNTVDDPQIYFNAKTGPIGIWATSLFMEDGSGTYQNICTASDGTLTSSNRTTATTKIANTNGFKPGSNIYYTNTTYGENSNINGYSVVYNNVNLFDSRYAFNTSLTAGSLTAYELVYLVGTIGVDGLFYLDETWWTQTPNETNKVYVLVGGCYDSTTSNCRISLYQHNPWYYYNGTALQPLYAIKNHTHGNITNDGKIGTTTDLAVVTTTNGEITTANLTTSNPDASGSGTAFVATVSQDSKGKLTIARKYVQDGTTSQKGIVQIGSTASTVAAGDHNHNSTYLKLDGSNNMSGDINIITGDSDKAVNFWYNTNKKAGASWRIAMLGTGSSDTNYFVIQSGSSSTTATTWNNTIRIGQNTFDVQVSGNLYPSATNTKTLGTSNFKWANVYATTFNGALSGNADTASKFNSNRTVALTGDVTGSVSGDGSSGWSVATTIGSGKVTNAMLAGSINRNKLLSNSISIAGTSVMLGDSIDATTLRTNLGLTNAMHFLGVTTTNISTSLTTQAVTIGDNSVTAADGDVVLYGSKEYVWGNSTWNLLGDEGSYKIKQDAITSPTANGTAGAFIDTISQNANGQITATKKTISITKSQISDFPTSMTPSSHSHGNITNGGAIGSTANYAVYTTTSGKLTAGTLAVSSPTADGTASAFIDTISQDSKGQITATKKTISITKSQISDFPTSMTPTSHTHGNITNAGALGTASVAVVTDSNKKITTANLSVSDPTANGSGLSFIATASQDGQGKISITKQTVQTASTEQPGVVQLGVANGAATYEHNHSGVYKPVQTAVTSPTADGTAGAFIDTISQNTNGVISVTKKTISITKSQISDFPTTMTPASHTHGNITNGGAIGSTADYAVYTTTSGKLTAGSLAVTSPTADGTAAAFIDTISQDSKGKITATKKTISITKSQISDFPTSMTPTSHTHGNITNTGTLSTASVAVVTDSNKKITTADLAVSDPTANGSGLTFIATASQNGQGKITITKQTVQTASTEQAGVVQLGVSGGAATYEHNHSGVYKPIQTAVSSPAADGTAAAFIDSISQNTNGVISVTKKTVSITKSQISDFPTSMTPTSHSHGNIANGGTLGTASVAVVTDGNKKITTSDLTVSDPTANGNGLTFISTISQNGQGKITATKKTVQAASTTQAGIIQIGTGATNAAAGNHTHSYLSAISWDSTNKKITKSINGGTAANIVQFTAGNNISLSANSTSLTIGLTVQNNNANLSWGTTSTVATVGSTDINVTMPGIEIVRL